MKHNPQVDYETADMEFQISSGQHMASAQPVSGGLAKPQLDKDLNLLARMVLLHLHEVFFKLFDLEADDRSDLDITTLLTSHIWTIYTVIKQEINGKGTVKDKIQDATELMVKNISRRVSDLKRSFILTLDVYKLKIDTSADGKKFKGCFQSNLAQVYCFKFRVAETVYMNRKYKLGEVGADSTVIDVGRYGVGLRHMALCYGANFTPAMQTALMQQLGPGALLIGLLRQTDVVYQAKWIKAVVQQMLGVPKIEAIAREIAGKGTNRQDIVGKVFRLMSCGCGKGIL